MSLENLALGINVSIILIETLEDSSCFQDF